MDLFKQKSSKGSAPFPSEYTDVLFTLTFLCEQTNMLRETQIRPLHLSENLILTIYRGLRIGLRMYY